MLHWVADDTRTLLGGSDASPPQNTCILDTRQDTLPVHMMYCTGARAANSKHTSQHQASITGCITHPVAQLHTF